MTQKICWLIWASTRNELSCFMEDPRDLMRLASGSFKQTGDCCLDTACVIHESYNWCCQFIILHEVKKQLDQLRGKNALVTTKDNVLSQEVSGSQVAKDWKRIFEEVLLSMLILLIFILHLCSHPSWALLECNFGYTFLSQIVLTVWCWIHYKWKWEDLKMKSVV